VDLSTINVEKKSVPLWRQIQVTAGVVRLVQKGVSGTAAIDGVREELRPGVQALAFEVWRNLGRAQALRDKLAKQLPPPDTDALLCVALALAWRGVDGPYDEFTLVNQVVEAAKRSPSTRMQAKFLNACMRRFLRERAALVASTDADPVAMWNHPAWWIQRLKIEQPLQWQNILNVSNRHAPMSLRVNVRKTRVADFLVELERIGLTAAVGANGAVYLDEPVSVNTVPGFPSGWVSVQDAAAQLAAPLLLDGMAGNIGLRILDACAAPGGKTGHLAELSDGDITSLDVDTKRCGRISENLNRLGLAARIVNADALRPQDWWDGEYFDAILLDAPCTASGIVRRHPDVRWLRREADVGKLAALQQRMMQALWTVLKPGGRMLYCTCSIFLAEGAEQIKAFLAHNTDANLLVSPGHLMPENRTKAGDVSDNPMCDHDGFFLALLQKRMV
jgi:16S rRNA (cytosine967-C5)-methyltransferase